jgi:enoyl-CoA hydratase/carnithine racemase
VRVVLLQGHETVFLAGNDIGDFLNKPPSGENSPVFRFLHGIASFCRCWRRVRAGRGRRHHAVPL